MEPRGLWLVPDRSFALASSTRTLRSDFAILDILSPVIPVLASFHINEPRSQTLSKVLGPIANLLTCPHAHLPVFNRNQQIFKDEMSITVPNVA